MIFHRHTWALRATQHVRLLWGGKPYGDATEALYVCETCGKTKTKEYEGLWTLEQLRGTRP